MDTAQEILYGGFPRTVAHASGSDLRQFFVHSSGAMDLFINHNRANKNLYSSICRFRSDMRPVNSSVPFDFDAPLKDSIFDNISDIEKIENMRKNEDLAYEVLGNVWDDVQSLVKQCRKDGVPVLTVFSGLGVHCHLLYQDRVNPTEGKVSISNYYIDKCDLDTYDRKIIPDTRRILRIPNSQRIDGNNNSSVWCIPITEDEVLNNSVHDLLERCASPKSIEYHERYRKENRPQMEVKEGYEEVDNDTVGTVELDDRNITEEVPELTEWIVRNCITLPCLRERFLRSNPDHHVRLGAVISLYESGFTPQEVQTIIKEVGWVDYDEDITKKMTEQIYSKGYSELSCGKMQSLGLCVFGPEFDGYSDDPSDCETHKYKSGEAQYPYDV